MGDHFHIKKSSYKSVNSVLLAFPYTVTDERSILMSGIYDPIDSLVSEVKRNVGFLDKMLFPKISLIIGFIGILIGIVLLIK